MHMFNITAINILYLFMVTSSIRRAFLVIAIDIFSNLTTMYVAGSKWNHLALTYRVDRYTGAGLSTEEVDQVMAQAFRVSNIMISSSSSSSFLSLSHSLSNEAIPPVSI